MSCILRMNNIYNELTEVDKKVADYINENKELISKLSVSELAQKSNVSSASIVRFSRKLGYSGFGELKIEIAKDAISKSKDYSYVEKDGDMSVNSVVSKITNTNIESITQTTKLNELSKIEDAIREIINSKTVYAFGVGGSALVALDLQQKLFRINKPIVTSLDTHTQMMVSSNLSSNDVAIAISYSGKSKEVIKSIENAKARGAKCISITKYGDNDLNRMCDINLFVPNIENKLREGAISSRIAMLTLIDIIYISIVQSDFNDAKSRFEASRMSVDYFKL
ncbi:MurR/RpiR family transcriptional regulator [Clostridium sp.]|uniref:MurR/RpiR family transcriptional regulator n=1 Tax=Clostridium sp. TaxID=1506 RepID=UPI003F40A220